jgi:hypothetical protein
VNEARSLAAATHDPIGAANIVASGVALVMFGNDCGSIKYLRALRHGFRHCFVAVYQAHGWVICDPLSHRTDLTIVGQFTAEELTAWFQRHGLLVVRTQIRPAPLHPAPVRPFTCVEAVKRVLGIHEPWVFTPWQLYRLLITKCPAEVAPLTSIQK